jgi:hypothetical protein
MTEQVEHDGLREAESDGLRGRLQRQGEDAIGRLLQELLESQIVHSAIARAFEAREKATAAQSAAMGALNLPSATDFERLTRRVRSLGQRLEGIEDGLDRLDTRLGALAGGGIDQRLGAIEAALEKLATDVEALGRKPAGPTRATKAAPPAK